MVKRLICIEGFDRIGKDTLLDMIKERNTSENIYVYRSEPKNLPNYESKKEFTKWLDNYIRCQVMDLNSLFNHYDTIIMGRFVLSDIVYSEVFDRQQVTLPIVRDHLRLDVNIINFITKWESYTEYLSRLVDINEEPQYNTKEFNKINDAFKPMHGNDECVEVSHDDSKEALYKWFKQFLDGLLGNETYKDGLDELRKKVREEDTRIFNGLVDLMELAYKIGETKAKHHIISERDDVEFGSRLSGLINDPRLNYEMTIDIWKIIYKYMSETERNSIIANTEKS